MTTPADHDQEEWRDARDHPLPRHRSHPILCRCAEQCWPEMWDPAEEES